MSNKSVSSPRSVPPPQSYLTFAVAAVVLAVVSLVPSLYMHIIRFISYTSPKLIDSDTQISYTIFILVIVSMITVVPISGIISLIFSIIVIKTKSQAYRIAIVALLFLVVGLVMYIALLPGFVTPFINNR